MNTITRERLEQALVNPAKITFNYGETLELARIALASLGAEKIAEPVAKVETVGVCWYADNGVPRKPAVGTELYAAPPAPVVQEDLLSMAASAIEDLLEHTDPSTSYYSGVWADVPGKLRAAILQGAEPVSNRDELPDDFISMLTGRAKYLREKGEIKSPELLERAAAALQGENFDTTAIPSGWKLVPIDPTKDMLRAGQSVVGFWLNTVHCYSKMLAAAPAAPQQEAE